MLKITTQGGETKEIDYKAGMQVKDVLEAVEMKASEKATITVDGNDAELNSSVGEDSLVVVTPNISNG